MPSANLTIARALQWARDYTDDAHERHWRRCIFQGIESDPLDQLLLMMLGGTMRSPLAKGCDAWSNAKGCACSVPLRMLGPSRTFVEIGANDGLHMANSWFFEAHLGWRGMCVEANPHVYQKLTSNRPRCINVTAVRLGSNPRVYPSCPSTVRQVESVRVPRSGRRDCRASRALAVRTRARWREPRCSLRRDGRRCTSSAPSCQQDPSLTYSPSMASPRLTCSWLMLRAQSMRSSAPSTSSAWSSS